jgi:ribose transport system permease protein
MSVSPPTNPPMNPPMKPAAVVRSRRVNAEFTREFVPVAVLIVLVIAVSAKDSSFLGIESLRTLADSSAALLILATGMTVVVMCGGIDLSVAALASLSSVSFAKWVPDLGLWAIAPVMIGALLAGALQGFIHVRAQIPSFVVTLGGMALWSGLALWICDATPIAITDRSVIGFGADRIAGIPKPVVTALVLAGLVALVLWATPLGRWVRAIGNSETAAYLAGAPVIATKIGALAFSGTCAGLAGCVLAARSYTGAPRLADTLLLPVVAAVVVGGTAITGGHGGIGRTIVGVMIVAVLRVGLSVVGIDQAWEQILYGTLVIVAAALTIDRSKLTILK